MLWRWHYETSTNACSSSTLEKCPTLHITPFWALKISISLPYKIAVSKLKFADSVEFGATNACTWFLIPSNLGVPWTCMTSSLTQFSGTNQFYYPHSWDTTLLTTPGVNGPIPLLVVVSYRIFKHACTKVALWVCVCVTTLAATYLVYMTKVRQHTVSHRLLKIYTCIVWTYWKCFVWEIWCHLPACHDVRLFLHQKDTNASWYDYKWLSRWTAS